MQAICFGLTFINFYSLIQAGLPVLTKVFTSKDDEGLSSAHTRGLPADHTGL